MYKSFTTFRFLSISKLGLKWKDSRLPTYFSPFRFLIFLYFPESADCLRSFSLCFKTVARTINIFNLSIVKYCWKHNFSFSNFHFFPITWYRNAIRLHEHLATQLLSIWWDGLYITGITVRDIDQCYDSDNHFIYLRKVYCDLSSI